MLEERSRKPQQFKAQSQVPTEKFPRKPGINGANTAGTKRLKRIKRGKFWRIFWPCFAVFLILAAVGGLVAAFWFKIPEEFWEQRLPLPEGDPVYVTIEPGMSGRQIAQAFVDQGAVIGKTERLIYWMVRLGVDRKIRPGHYQVVRSNPWYVARQLRGSRPALLKMTILPGADVITLREGLNLSTDGVLGKVPNTGNRASVVKTNDALHAAVMDNANYPTAMRSLLPATEESRIALLLPETYYVVDKTPAELVQAASDAWWKNCGVQAAKLSRAELENTAIIASMVEREVLFDSEGATVAGVINNRLKSGMSLQIDATVVYAWKLQGRKVTRVLNKDLTIDSPYNTYRFTGLPPHPICVPSLESWKAALSPEVNDWYYYVARRDGYHIFSRTYNEHRRNIEKARSE